MKTVNEMTEKELRESEVPYLKTEAELTAYISALVDRSHDYGTCVYAMSMAATAAFNYVASRLGSTGFQASCADMDILRRTRSLKSGFRIIDYGNLLYPQYCDDEHFPNWQGLLHKNAAQLVPLAKEKLETSPDAHPNVLHHWKMIASLPVHANGH